MAVQTTTPVDEAIVELLALSSYLVRTNNRVESFASRWALNTADDLYSKVHGPFEYDAEDRLTGRWVELDEQGEDLAKRVLRDAAAQD